MVVFRAVTWGRRSPGLFWTMVALVLSATIVSAQLELGAMQGTVTDDDGKPLEGVTFTLKDPERGREIVFRSDKNGRFYRRGVPAKEYEVKVEKEGYQPIQDTIRLNAGIDRRFDFKLARAAPVGAEEFNKGIEAFERGDPKAAVAAFEEAVKKAPEAPEVRVNLALAYLRTQRPDEAIAQLEKARELAPDNPLVLFQLGSAYLEADKNEKAIEYLEAGLAKQPNIAEPGAWEATVTLGAVYFAEGDNQKSTAAFEKALAARPTAAAPKLGLGKCAFNAGDVDKALSYFKDVVASAPGTPEATQAEAFIKELEKGKGPND